jgi:hypothetical protein
VLVALGLLAIIAVAFLSGIAIASNTMLIADERATAESIARSEMEQVKEVPYERSGTPTYEKTDGLVAGHPGYFVSIDAFFINPYDDEPLVDCGDGSPLLSAEPDDIVCDKDGSLTHPDSGDDLIFSEVWDIQKIIITVKHGTEAETAREVMTLDDYKVNR